jgi:hypothetical protein
MYVQHSRTRTETRAAQGQKIKYGGGAELNVCSDPRAESKCRLVISGRTIINLRRGREICQERDAAAAICTAIN